MERWALKRRKRDEGLTLANRTRTEFFVSQRVPGTFAVSQLLEDLESVGFPRNFMRGVERVNFTILKSNYGLYDDGEIWVDVKRKRRRLTILETFVHEVAHHIDFELEPDVSTELHADRKRKGKLIHRRAGKDDDEYFARGFERYYSLDPQKKLDLARRHKKLYARISKLHRKYQSKR